VLILAISLCACGSKAALFDKELYDPTTMGYVVLSVENNASPEAYRVANLLTFEDQDGRSVYFTLDGADAFMLAPGEYTLVNFAISGSNRQLTTYIDFEDALQGRFTVAAGEAVYIGHVDFEITDVHKSFFKKFFNMRTAASDVDYTTSVSNKFDSLSRRMSEDAGKPLNIRLMEWSKR
jgi:hypothetical protein